MARPRIHRNICGRPANSCYKPNGVPMTELKKITLLPDEFEAIRLADHEKLTQQEAAEQMGVSRQTFGNIVNSARYKVATGLVEGCALILGNEE